MAIGVDIPKYSVIQYVRNNKRVPYGVVVAVKTAYGYRVGYSLCNKRDKFNKRVALDVALGRTKTNLVGEPPHDIKRMIPSFLERCDKYYKPNT